MVAVGQVTIEMQTSWLDSVTVAAGQVGHPVTTVEIAALVVVGGGGQ